MKKSVLLLVFSIIFLSAFTQQAYAPFLYGVASGDPLTDKVILWTKLVPADTTQPVTVNWRIASDSSFNDVVNSGSVITDSSTEFSVKIDAAGLQPGNWYYYDFETGGIHSLRGRTKTAPGGNVSEAKFAVVTCAKFSKGFFNAYARIAERDDIDAVIHLGDYIYESNGSNGDMRPMDPNYTCFTLDDFRTRYKQYHGDPDLIRLRQQFPWINVWDDHETSNDCWMNGSEHWPDSSTFALVKQAATQVFFEWIPMRQDSTHPWRIYRKFEYGNLIDLLMLDTRREGREMQLPFADSNMAIINDTNRTILGHEQYNWLISNLDNSTAKWRIIGQQVMMAPALFFGNPLNNDQWDGYPAERSKLLSHIMNENIKNVVVLTGDIHASFANNIPLDFSQYNDETRAGSVAVEFITPAICSSASDFGNLPFSLVKTNDPHIQYANLKDNGYIILDVTPGKVQGDYYYVATTDSPDVNQTLAVSMYTLDGTRYFYRDTTSSVVQIAPQPDNVFEIFPNPVKNLLTVRFKTQTSGKLNLKIYDAGGKLVNVQNKEVQPGEQNAEISVADLSKGVYFLKGYLGRKELGNSKFVVEK